MEQKTYKRGRPLLSIDPCEVEQLAKQGLTLVEMAKELECSRQTIQNRFRQEVQMGRTKRDYIKRAQRERHRHTTNQLKD